MDSAERWASVPYSHISGPQRSAPLQACAAESACSAHAQHPHASQPTRLCPAPLPDSPSRPWAHGLCCYEARMPCPPSSPCGSCCHTPRLSPDASLPLPALLSPNKAHSCCSSTMAQAPVDTVTHKKHFCSLATDLQAPQLQSECHAQSALRAPPVPWIQQPRGHLVLRVRAQVQVLPAGSLCLPCVMSWHLGQGHSQKEGGGKKTP